MPDVLSFEGEERLRLYSGLRLLARDDQRDTICTGANMLTADGGGPVAPGWKPDILKQTGNPQTITFFFPTLTSGGAAGGGDAFEVEFAVRGINAQGLSQTETFTKQVLSKLGNSTGEAFSAYTTRARWRWVLEIELLRYVTTGATINGFYVGHAIGDRVETPPPWPGGYQYYDHDGTTYEVGRYLEIDAVWIHNRTAQTLSKMDPSKWDYAPDDGTLHVQDADWDDTCGLLVNRRFGRY